MSPVELIKVTQQCAQQRGIVSARRVVQDVWHSSHQQSWRCGLNATLLRDGIPHGVWFVAYDVAKDIMMRSMGIDKEDENLPVQVPLVSGAVAATVAWAVGCTFCFICIEVVMMNYVTFRKSLVCRLVFAHVSRRLVLNAVQIPPI